MPTLVRRATQPFRADRTPMVDPNFERLVHADRELAIMVAGGRDEAAFRALYRRHTPRLFQVLTRVLGNRADAEDAIQETWIRAVESLPSFRWESAFQTWVIGIGINVARNLVRARHEHAALSPDAPSLRRQSVDDQIDIEQALSQLPIGQRTVLVLHDVEGWTHQNIAERLGTSAGTSKSQLFDARRALRALLDPDAGATGTTSTGQMRS